MLNKIYTFILLIMFTVLSKGPTETITMTTCNPDSQDAIISFNVPIIDALKKIGWKLTEGDTIYDTGSCLVYLIGLDVYWLTKRDEEAQRYDGEIFKYLGHKCIERRFEFDTLQKR